MHVISLIVLMLQIGIFLLSSNFFADFLLWSVIIPIYYRRVAQISQSHAYYVFNVEEDGGFVIVSADDRTEEILGYSDTGTFDTSNMPDNVKSWLGYYEQVIRSLGDLQIQTTPRSAQHADIAPLVKTTWGQG